MKILGLGTHITECLRVAQLIERHGEHFVTRVYTPSEIAYCSSRRAATQQYAAHWAAKEAVLQALGLGWIRGVYWPEVEIEVDAAGQVHCEVMGGAARACETLAVKELHVTMAFCRGYATGYALAVGKDDGN